MKGPLKSLGAGLFKGTAFLGAIIVIAATWTYDASILVAGEDLNLRLIKTVAAWLPAGYGSKTEAALRLFGADKAFLFTEMVAAVKLSMLAVGRLFRLPTNRKEVGHDRRCKYETKGD